MGQQYRIQVWGRNPGRTVVQDPGVGGHPGGTGYRCGGTARWGGIQDTNVGGHSGGTVVQDTGVGEKSRWDSNTGVWGHPGGTVVQDTDVEGQPGGAVFKIGVGGHSGGTV